MSWEEYKKKNNIKQNNFSTIQQQSQRNIAPINKNVNSSWEEYKRKNNIKTNKFSEEDKKRKQKEQTEQNNKRPTSIMRISKNNRQCKRWGTKKWNRRKKKD